MIKDGLKMLKHSMDLGLSNSEVVTGVDTSEGWEWSSRDATLKGDWWECCGPWDRGGVLNMRLVGQRSSVGDCLGQSHVIRD